MMPFRLRWLSMAKLSLPGRGKAVTAHRRHARPAHATGEIAERLARELAQVLHRPDLGEPRQVFEPDSSAPEVLGAHMRCPYAGG
jgi:hypothetical protein